jgi:transaldolase
MLKLSDLKVKLFTDGADKAQILEMAAKPWIRGFTTNPLSAAELSLGAVKAFREDALAAGLTLTVAGAARAAE